MDKKETYKMRVVYRYKNKTFKKIEFKSLKKGDKFILLEIEPTSNIPRLAVDKIETAKSNPAISDGMNVLNIRIK